MKKICIALLAFAALPFGLLAQEIREEKMETVEAPEAKEKAEKKETREIIIRQKGDKDINLKVEVNGDKITVNGKPLSEFKDKDITINNRKMIITDGNKVLGNFDFNGEGLEQFGENFGDNFMKSWGGQEDGKGAFLGVTTEAVEGGVKITEVVKGSAAEKAGLKKADIITKIGDEKITSPEELSDVIGFKKPTDEIKIAYKREGKNNTVKTVLGSRKQSKTRSYSFSSPGGNGSIHSFTFPPTPPMPPATNMEGLNSDLFDLRENALAHVFPRKKIGLKIQDIEDGSGVKVINVEDSSASFTAGIKKDDIITEINGKKIDNTDDAREELMPGEDKKLYKIKVNRAGTEMNFDVKIPKKLKTANL